VNIEYWTDSVPGSTYVRDVEECRPYEPGRFYIRELPCLLSVLSLLPQNPHLVVVDGYVWLGRNKEPGLGFHLHQAFAHVPVVGIAKTRFRGIDGSELMQAVYRGKSRNPLYVTAIGIDLNEASAAVTSMHGEYRIPEILRLTDRLARTSSDQLA
jgi:deoxyribonuclease V